MSDVWNRAMSRLECKCIYDEQIKSFLGREKSGFSCCALRMLHDWSASTNGAKTFSILTSCNSAKRFSSECESRRIFVLCYKVSLTLSFHYTHTR